MRIVGDDLPGLHHDAEQDVLGSAALVRRYDLLEAKDILDRVPKAIPAAGAGIGLVAAHQGAPGVRGHGAGAGVRQQVDDHVLGAQQESIVVSPRIRSSRSPRVVSLIGSTILIRKGSMMVFIRGMLVSIETGLDKGNYCV